MKAYFSDHASANFTYDILKENATYDIPILIK